jgi:hypothetical protein
MNGKMHASMLAALGFLFQASCGSAPGSEPDTEGAGGAAPGSKAETQLSQADTQASAADTQEESFAVAPAPILEPASGADRLFRGEFLFGGQSLQDTDCHYSLQMRSSGGLSTWEAGWFELPYWGAGSSNPYNYLAYWYPASQGGNANLLVLNRAGTVLWESDTWSSGSYEVVQQTDANVVMYAGGGYVPWASNQVFGGSFMCNPDGTGPNGLVGMKTRMMLNKDLFGMDLTGFPSPTLGQCGSACATNASCHAFTYWNGTCFLKSGQPSGTDCSNGRACVKNLSGATSGRKLVGNYTWF